MPSVAEEQPIISQGKKRRRDDDLEASLYEKLGYSTGTGHDFSRPHHQNLFAVIDNNERLIVQPDNQSEPLLPSVSRKIFPLPVTKRIRILDEKEADAETTPSRDSEHYGSRPRARHSCSPVSQSRVLQNQSDAGNRPQPTRSNSTLLLSPCHICHRRPTKKSDLDSFAGCQGCGQRTCFVCIRECLGWLPEQQDGQHDEDDILSEQEALSRSFHMDDVDDNTEESRQESSGLHSDGYAEHSSHRRTDKEGGWTTGGHSQMVCSRCCIEKGPEGDVVCLGCLSRMEVV